MDEILMLVFLLIILMMIAAFVLPIVALVISIRTRNRIQQRVASLESSLSASVSPGQQTAIPVGSALPSKIQQIEARLERLEAAWSVPPGPASEIERKLTQVLNEPERERPAEAPR